MSREEALRRLNAEVRARFDTAQSVATNESTNPATPMCVSVTWRTKRGLRVKAVRAHTITVDPDAFRRYALAQLDEFYEANVRGRLFEPA
ncbi:MAG TPA: hypothetical protein VG897_13690 [Terriglobales bacterium]|nr:hypothetical protein [Terriglobales bacterium]